MTNERRAVIDVGSNSIRLVIYQQGPHGMQREIDNLKQTARLSAHLNSNNEIDEQGILVTTQVLNQFKQLLHAYGVTDTVSVATQAIRGAANRDFVLARIADATGINIRILSGHEEAHYGYLAAVNSIAINDGITVDVGGGSTEISYFQDRRLVHSTSIPYGAVSLTNLVAPSDPLSPKDLKKLERTIRGKLDEFPWLTGLRCPIVGMGGTARTIARVHQRQRHYPLPILHGYEVRAMEVSAIVDLLRSTPLEKRKDIDGLSGDRADIIVAGSTIIDQILKRADAPSFIVSNKGLRDGVLIEQVLRDRHEDLLSDMLLYSIENLHDQFQVDRQHAHHVWTLADELWSSLVQNGWMKESEEARRWLQVGALLHGVGQTVSIYNSSQHTFYILLQVPLFGITHRDRVFASAVASFKSQKQMAATLSEFQQFLEEDDLSTLCQLGMVLGLAKALDRTRTGQVSTARLQKHGSGWVLRIDAKEPLGIEVNQATDWLKRWRKVFPQEVRLEVD